MLVGGAALPAGDERLRKCLQRLSLHQLMPIQVCCWEKLQPVPLERDFQIIASTGRGKTLSYVLPLLNSLTKHTLRQRAILVIVPNLELAKQTAAAFHPFAEAISVKVTTLNSVQCQVGAVAALRFRRGKRFCTPITQACCSRSEAHDEHEQDVLIVTPSQMLRATGKCNSQFPVCVVDEADKLTQQQHQGWLLHSRSSLFATKHLAIISVGERSYKTTRTILVSATLGINGTVAQHFHTHAVQNVLEARSDLDEVGKIFLSPGLAEICLRTKPAQKLAVLQRILELFDGLSILVLTSSVRARNTVWCAVKKIQPAMLPVKYGSALTKAQQQSSLDAFRSGESQLMIASDAAARGLDIPLVKVVILYDIPQSVETFTHRVGRTARADTKGVSITLCSKAESHVFDTIMSSVVHHSPVIYLSGDDILNHELPQELASMRRWCS